MTRYGSSVGLAVILAVACLAYGAVTPVERVIVASGLAFHAAWMGRREQVRDMRLEGKWLVAASWLFVVCCVLPLIPAPLALRQLLSPVMTEVQHQVWPQQWRPLSPDPVALSLIHI